MSANPQLNYYDIEDDDDSNMIYSSRLRGGRRPVNFKVKSEINQKLLRKETWQPKRKTSGKPNITPASAKIDILDTINIIDTFDRAGNAKAEGNYARCRNYAVAFEDKPGQRIPKAGVYAEAGVGRACAEFSVFEAEAKGPNASAGVEVNVVGVGAMARAEVASASAKAGPIGVKLGLGVDSGASVGLGGVEAKFLGTGFSIGPKTSVSVVGSEVSCSIM